MGGIASHGSAWAVFVRALPDTSGVHLGKRQRESATKIERKFGITKRFCGNFQNGR